MRLIDSNRVTYGTKLSEHIWEDNNGQLICRDAIIARTGSYDYLESEIIEGGDRNKIVKVFRTDDEVFDPVSIASFENKPFVDDHPQEDVSPENFRELSMGYMRDVRRGTGELSNCLICDIVVTDPDVIESIKSGEKRELSLGYDTHIVRKNGEYIMTKIRGNHLALVNSGRAGCATIRDSAQKLNKAGGIDMKKSRVTLFDEDIYEVEEIREEDNDNVLLEETTDADEEVVAETVETTDDAEPTLGEIKELLLQVLAKLDAPKADVQDEEGEPVKEGEEITDDIVEQEEGVQDEEEPVVEGVEDDEEELVEDDEEAVAEEELLDADEISEDETEATKTKDAKSVYSKFAKVGDTRSNVIKTEVQKSWQDRYNQMAKKSY